MFSSIKLFELSIDDLPASFNITIQSEEKFRSILYELYNRYFIIKFYFCFFILRIIYI